MMVEGPSQSEVVGRSPNARHVIPVQRRIPADNRNTFYFRLSDQQAVKRILVWPWQKTSSNRVFGGNGQLHEALAVELPLKIVQDRATVEFPRLMFDGNFPKRSRGDENRSSDSRPFGVLAQKVSCRLRATTSGRECPAVHLSIEAPIREFLLGHRRESIWRIRNLSFQPSGNAFLSGRRQGHQLNYGLLAASDYHIFASASFTNQFRQISLGLMDGIHG